MPFGISLILLAAAAPMPQNPNTLSGWEKSVGYQLLFDGKSMDGWRRWRGAGVPSGWSASEGAIVFTPGREGGDICSEAEFSDFDLKIEWSIAKAGNSGIFYRASEVHEAPWATAPEYQILDTDRHPDGRSPLTSAGSVYAMFAPSIKITKPVGEWNEARIVARGPRVEHWLNGTKIVSYTIGSPEWDAQFRQSKFQDLPGYAKNPRGRFVLQDHGDVVRYRSIRVRNLDR